MERKNEIPKAKNQDDVLEQFQAFVEIVRILRRDCPWDRKQTNESIAQLLIEETYETIDAINKHDDEEFSGELGDLLLHIVMHSVMAEERDAFNLIDVLKKIQNKLVHRHPHVFGSVEVANVGEVLQNWEHLKISEGRKSVLEGVPDSLPALLRAQRIQYKASKVGFDWSERKDVWEKIEEELKEYKREILDGNMKKAGEELGDILFAIVNAARFEDIIAEEMLQKANDKFKRRFEYIEQRAVEMNLSLTDMTLEEMDKIWDEAKELEK